MLKIKIKKIKERSFVATPISLLLFCIVLYTRHAELALTVSQRTFGPVSLVVLKLDSYVIGVKNDHKRIRTNGNVSGVQKMFTNAIISLKD